MDDSQARILMEVQAIVVEVEAMKAANQHWALQNAEAQYSEHDFYDKAQEIRALAHDFANA